MSNNNSKPIPILYTRKEDCCGCTACYAICPKSAISMQPDEEGFDYPVVDAEKCVRCYMCLKVCPIKAAKKEFSAKIVTESAVCCSFATSSKDNQVRK